MKLWIKEKKNIACIAYRRNQPLQLLDVQMIELDVQMIGQSQA